MEKIETYRADRAALRKTRRNGSEKCEES